MQGKTDKNPQLNIGEVPLVHFINLESELCRLSKKINWESVEKEFAVFYSSKGAPSIPVRIMVGITLLKKVYGYSNKRSIENWIENPYWQHFCGEIYFQSKPPLHHSDFSHFRHRVGQKGEDIILKLGEEVFGEAFARGSRWENRHGMEVPKNKLTGFIHSLGSYLVRISGGSVIGNR